MKIETKSNDLLTNFYEKVKNGDLAEIFTITLPIALIHKILFVNGEEFLKENFALLNSEIDVLASLYTNNKVLTPTQLYDLTIFSSGGMTKVLKRLEERGYIYRKADAKDKRCMLVCLSKEGEALTKQALNEISKECSKYFSILDKEESELFKKLLKKVATNLRATST